MAELVDAIDSKSVVPWDVSVRFGSEVPNVLIQLQVALVYFFIFTRHESRPALRGTPIPNPIQIGFFNQIRYNHQI